MAVARADDDVEILKVVIVNGEPEIYKTNVSPHASAALAHGWSAQCSLHRKLVSLCSHHDSVAAMCLVRLTQSRSAARGAWETRKRACLYTCLESSEPSFKRFCVCRKGRSQSV